MFGRKKKKDARIVEKRGAYRHDCYQSTFYGAAVAGSLETAKCDIFDLSATGARFHCKENLDPGSRVVLLLRHHERMMKMDAVVMWHRQFMEHKYGARFLQPGPEWPGMLQEMFG